MSQLHVWIRCLYELVKPEMRYNNDADQFEGTWTATNGNEVFVIGDQCRLLRSAVIRLAARGYAVIVETNDPETAPRIPRVSWVTSEYTAKVPEKDCPEFDWILCLGCAGKLKVYQKRFAHRKLGAQLLIETGVETKVIDQSDTITTAVVVETGDEWLQREPLSLWLWPSSASRRKVETLSINNELVTSQGLSQEDRPVSNSHQQVHVDDISELCIDVLAGISEQESDTCNQQILKDCMDRFNQRIRPLYN
jgi:hypothetical protein